MQDLRSLEAITHVFEAMSEPEKWQGALDKLAATCQAKSMIFDFYDPVHGVTLNQMFSHYSSFLSAGVLNAYGVQFGHMEVAARNRAIDLDLHVPEHTPIADLDVYDHQGKGLDHDLFNEAVHGVPVKRRNAQILGRYEPWRAMITTQFDVIYDDFPEGSLEQQRILAPYIQRALQSGRYLMVLKQKYAMILDALDRLRIGTAIIKNNNDLVLANTSFERLLFESSVFKKTFQSKVSLLDPDLNHHFARALQRASALQSAEPLGKGETLVAYRSDGRPPISIEVSPLRSSEFAQTTESGYAICFVVDPEWKLVTRSQAFVQAYNLTPAEATNLELILEGFKDAEIAEQRGVSSETIKSQNRSIFSKAHVTNRTELARLAAATEIPLVED